MQVSLRCRIKRSKEACEEKILEKYGIGGFAAVLALLFLTAGVIPNSYKVISIALSDDFVQTQAWIEEVQENAAAAYFLIKRKGQREDFTAASKTTA